MNKSSKGGNGTGNSYPAPKKIVPAKDSKSGPTKANTTKMPKTATTSRKSNMK